MKYTNIASASNVQTYASIRDSLNPKNQNQINSKYKALDVYLNSVQTPKVGKKLSSKQRSGSLESSQKIDI